MKIQLCVIVSLSCLVGEVWAQGDTAVAVSPITKKIVWPRQSFVGTVAPSRQSVVGSAVDGRVTDVFVEDGDAVAIQLGDDATPSIGQPIAQLRTGTITIEIAAARAELALREQELAEAEAGSRPEEIAQAEARLKAAIAVMKFASTRYERVKALRATSTSSQEEFEEAQSLFLAAEQRQIEAQAGYELAVKGPRREVVEQTRARMQSASEAVNRLEDMRKKYTIRAPFNGYVTVKHTEVGAWVSRGDPVAEIVQLDPIEIRLAVPETYITNVHIGDDTEVRLESTAEAEIGGKITRIVPLADRRSRTFPVIIRLANPPENGEHLMKAGMLAHVTIRVGQKQSVLTVPKDALVLDGKSASIVVIETDPDTKQSVARVVTVSLGVEIRSSIQVIDPTDSLREGQSVVTRGNERLRDKQPVEIVEFERTATP
ncbi:MAG: efflux RND transporter periplasmic adaptor subunit [Pirellulaceae bacterium]|jgi:RND family efflux transporter MFP subunit|nr:efflux RND transporter periplasmic adaptor subunit [Pirellulaceae bacterium]MDP6557354.1 efflux RND transporter periplasmic adaptor subunit [Pirellulaceae bacterium]MDP6720350.1 efflux RND transporter periplasmic adaptor subunit [Pirellulaceae bacterium]